MDDHGDDDERAAAALDALRRGSAEPGPPAGVAEVLDDLVGRVRRSPTRSLAVAIGLVVVVGALAVVALRPAGTPEPGDDALFTAPATAVATVPATTEPVPATIVVHAAGAVVAPGVYALPEGARVADLVDRAGGTAPDADLDRLNLAAALDDGQRVYVPRLGEAVPPAVAPGASDGATAGGAGGGDVAGPLDLNAASAEQLDELPGVGPATAAAIVEHRARNGPFASVDALMDVRGIGPAKLEALRDLVTVG